MSEQLFDPYLSEDLRPAHSEHWHAKRRVASAIRELTEVLTTSVPPVADLHAMAEQLEATAARFRQCERLYGRTPYSERGEHGSYGEIFHEMSPVSGVGNPLAPPLNMWMTDGEAHGSATLGWAYEGPPGCVHGGYVAALFDDFMGMAQRLGKQPGMTGSLLVRYRRPTPLNTELRLRAWLASAEGRKTRIKAEMCAGDTVTAECEALFIRPKAGLEPLREAVRKHNQARGD